jgi:hypothetical protein
MRNLAFLTSPFVSIVVSLLIALGKNQHSQHAGEFDTYYFPSPYKWLCVGVAVVFATSPLLPGIVGDANPFLFYGFLGVASFVCVLVALYFAKYRLTIGPDMFVVGAFWTRAYLLKDISSTKLIPGRYDDEFLVYMQSGKVIHISGLLTDFRSLPSSLYAPIEVSK